MRYPRTKTHRERGREREATAAVELLLVHITHTKSICAEVARVAFWVVSASTKSSTTRSLRAMLTENTRTDCPQLFTPPVWKTSFVALDKILEKSKGTPHSTTHYYCCTESPHRKGQFTTCVDFDLLYSLPSVLSTCGWTVPYLASNVGGGDCGAVVI